MTSAYISADSGRQVHWPKKFQVDLKINEEGNRTSINGRRAPASTRTANGRSST